MVTQASASSFQRSVGEHLDRVARFGDSIVVEDGGQPVAALVDARTYAQICRMRDEFDAAAAKLAASFADVPDQEGVAEIDRALAEIRTSGVDPTKR